MGCERCFLFNHLVFSLTNVLACVFNRAFRELISFWGDMSTSISMSTPPPLPPVPPSIVDFPGFDWDFFSMSMSMPVGDSIVGVMSMSMPAGDTIVGVGTVVDDAGVGTTGGSDGATTTNDEEDTDPASTNNLGKNTNSSSSAGPSTPQTVLFIVLVGAAMAVMSAWYVRKNQRASSNASQMTPASSPIL